MTRDGLGGTAARPCPPPESFGSGDQGLLAWFWQVDARLMGLSVHWPACAGGQFRVGEGRYVTEGQFFDALPTRRLRDLYLCLANDCEQTCGEGRKVEEYVAHLGDEAWLARAADESTEAPDAAAFYVECDEREAADVREDEEECR